MADYSEENIQRNLKKLKKDRFERWFMARKRKALGRKIPHGFHVEFERMIDCYHFERELGPEEIRENFAIVGKVRPWDDDDSEYVMYGDGEFIAVHIEPSYCLRPRYEPRLNFEKSDWVVSKLIIPMLNLGLVRWYHSFFLREKHFLGKINIKMFRWGYRFLEWSYYRRNVLHKCGPSRRICSFVYFLTMPYGS